ncbi:Gfo/Idh/MocA family protein [Paenibacillus piscarius]|uniref:Gfo/Idh/MocA family protein n=1 Tax=Paenibacillus piscarius TaxID=1089681 RepID=UPI001EE980A2|nr:Gfo/Idh/MocA family oxidoreductase [Paenibacillus piscarius]
MRNIRFGIIGYGFMGQTHAETIAKLEYAELAAVCDIDAAKRPAEQAVEFFDNANEFFAKGRFDTVIIAVPNHLHLEMVEKAAKSGKDIICEKPAAMNAEELQEMITLTQQAGVLFTVHHQRRLDQDFQTAKRVYEERAVGEVYVIKSSLYGFNGNMHDWHIYPHYGGGMLYDWGVHLIDQLLFMVPHKIQTVNARLRNVINANVDDYFNIQLTFENGLIAEIELGTYFLNDSERWFERHWFIGGNEGSCVIDGFQPEARLVRTSELLTNTPSKSTITHAGPTRSFGNPPPGRILTESVAIEQTAHSMFFDNFVKAKNKQAELLVKPAEMLRLMELVDLIRKSSEDAQSYPFDK